MISRNSRIKIIDNSGAKEALVINIPGNSSRRYANIGDIVTVTIKKSLPSGLVKKGEKSKALILRTKTGIREKNGFRIRFDDNAAVIIKDDMNLKGTRIFGPIVKNKKLRNKSFSKLFSLAEKVFII
jgi:large subunit ribosomal protein L14